eukprot:scaffold139097_cov81-Phaeocystis_antarctica.AAC.1
MRCDPASLRPSQPRSFPARLSLPPTMLAPTRLHPNPLVCPDRSNSHRSIDVSPHPRCYLCLPTRSCTCLAMPIHHAAHSLHVIARDKRLILTTSASSYTPQLILTTSASSYTPQLIPTTSASSHTPQPPVTPRLISTTSASSYTPRLISTTSASSHTPRLISTTSASSYTPRLILTT